MRRRKTYDEAFKRQLAHEAVTGATSVAALTEQYKLGTGILYRWVHQYEEVAEPGPEGDTRALKGRVAELERMVGRLAMENDFLKKFAAYTKQRTNERLSIVTPQNWVPPRPAGSLGLPAARTTIGSETAPPRPLKTPGSKNG